MAPEKVIEKFLNGYDKESTRYGYASALYCFFGLIYNYSRQNTRVSTQDKEQFELLAKRYLTEKRDYKEDILLFQKNCDKPTKTILNYRSIVLEFLRMNKIHLDYDEFKRIKQKTPKRYELKQDGELTIEVIRSILQHADVRMQALFYVLLSTGLRISEVLSLELSHYSKIEDGYGKLHLQWYDAKTGREVIALITPETVSVIDEWLKVREKYIREKCINSELKVKDNRIFPFTKNVATQSFHHILERAGYPQEGKNYPYHFHQFRSYFSSQLKLSVHPEIVEYLIGGHSQNINAIYRKYSFRQVLDAYKGASDALTIGTDPVLKKKYQSSIKELEKVQQNQSLNNEQIATLIIQLGTYQSQFKAMEEKIKLLENVVNAVADGKIKIRAEGNTVLIE